LADRAIIVADTVQATGSSQSVRGVTLMRLRDGLLVEALAYVKSGDSSVATAVRNAASGAGTT
jgi:hypothetical protein